MFDRHKSKGSNRFNKGSYLSNLLEVPDQKQLIGSSSFVRSLNDSFIEFLFFMVKLRMAIKAHDQQSFSQTSQLYET